MDVLVRLRSNYFFISMIFFFKYLLRKVWSCLFSINCFTYFSLSYINFVLLILKHF